MIPFFQHYFSGGSMRKSLLLSLFVAFAATMLTGTDAKAILVDYTTVGSFSGGDAPGGSTYLDAANGISISFLSGIDSVDVGPASQVSFGTFDTSGTTSPSFVPVSSGFTLDIFQTNPVAGVATFVGTLSGELRINNSQAIIVFDPPLTAAIGAILYEIVSADDGNPGQVNLAPPTTNGGLTTIVGRVGLVPEPSTFALLGLGAPVLFLAARRRKASLSAA
jgi:hypothetical protein